MLAHGRGEKGGPGAVGWIRRRAVSLTILAGVAGALVAVAAAALLWRESVRREPSVRNAYRALAAAALLWGAGFVDAEGMAASGTGTSLTSADLLTLLALPALAVGLFGLARANREADGDDRPAPRAQARGAVAWLADACLLATALFIIDWVAVLGAEYRRTGESAGAFALQAIHPIADLIALGVLLARRGAGRAGRGWRRTWPCSWWRWPTRSRSAPGSAACAPGAGAVVVALAGFCLLGAAALVRADRAPSAAAAAAGLARAGRAAGRHAGGGAGGRRGRDDDDRLGPERRIVRRAGRGDLRGNRRAGAGRQDRRPAAPGAQRRPRSRAESEHRFRELADRTSDVVLICDRDGIIRYASPAVGEYGYTPAELAGRSLSELVHPEDRAAGVRTVRAAGAGRQPGRFPCRVRSADGTWRHVESTVSRYREMGAPDRLLITARDVSDQIALRRQVTYLTYHDGLTGLPNRAYVEDRAKDAIDRGAAAEPGPAARAGRGDLHRPGRLHRGQRLRRARRGRPAAGPGRPPPARGRAAGGHGGPLGRRRVRGAGRERRERAGDRGHRRAPRRGHQPPSRSTSPTARSP